MSHFCFVASFVCLFNFIFSYLFFFGGWGGGGVVETVHKQEQLQPTVLGKSNYMVSCRFKFFQLQHTYSIQNYFMHLIYM